jgi:hypothetical protein
MTIGLRFACAIILALLSSFAVGQGSGRTISETASASAFANHPRGCVLLNLQATQVKLDRQVTEKLLTVSLFHEPSGVDCGSGPTLELLASGQTAQFELVIEPRLTGARVSTTLPLLVHTTGSTSTFTIDVRWTGVSGQLYPERHRQFETGLNTPSRTALSHTHGYSRAATINAVVADGTTDYIANTFQSEGTLNVSTTFAYRPESRSFR